jgi:hypothetical protein
MAVRVAEHLVITALLGQARLLDTVSKIPPTATDLVPMVEVVTTAEVGHQAVEVVPT